MGRLQSYDSRDFNYLLSPPPLSKHQRKYKFWYTFPAFDQGESPHCVAFSVLKFLESGPIKQMPDWKPHWFYNQCKLIDGISEEGTTLRAAFKLMKNLGYISEYRWAFNTDDIARYVLNVGPMVVGTLWTDGMDEVKNGFISPKGRVKGGHAYMIKGVNLQTKCPDGTIGAFRIMNSWGDWGKRGCASISITDFGNLMSVFGEACAATEILKK